MTEKPTLAEALADVAIRPTSWRTGAEQRLVCPACNGGTTRSRDLALRLDEDGGAVWRCHRGKCGWSGNIPASKVRGGRSGPPSPRQDKPTVLPTPDEVEDRPEKLYDFWAKRGVSRQTVDEFGIYLKPGVWFPQLKGEASEETTAIVFPYREGGELVNRKYRGYRTIEVDDGQGGKRRAIDKIHRQDKDAKKVLFNVDCLDGIGQGDVLYLVEGEPDVVALREAGIVHAISLPDGSDKTLKAEDDPSRAQDKRFFPLEDRIEDIRRAGKIVIAGDDDLPGRNLAEEFARRIGKDIVWRITGWPPGCKDSGDVLREHGAESLREWLEMAQPWQNDGIFDGVSAADLTIHRDEDRPQPLTTGLRSLDGIFRLPQHGSLVVVTGPPGHGKTSLWNAITVQAGVHHGWHTIFCSPEMGRMDSAAYMASIKVGGSFYSKGGISHAQMSEAATFLTRHVTFLDREEEKISLDWTIDAIRRVVARKGSKLVILDGMKDFDLYKSTAADPKEAKEIERARQAKLYPVFLQDRLSELKRLSKELGIVLVLVAHPHQLKRDRDGRYPTPTGYDIAGGAPWFDNAEVGITVERGKADGSVRVLTWKARHKLYSSYGEADLSFDRETGRFFDTSGPSEVPAGAPAPAVDDDIPWESAS